ncbi:hypothetical protein B0H14DRAFT_3460504 [Mycena olivaceomarginata]|nr:hypothetical protein B0H14DRAFT_3460504 [Mycena olivaceomarginata]
MSHSDVRLLAFSYFMLCSQRPFLAAIVVLVVGGAPLVAADTNNGSMNHSEAVIGLILAIVFLPLICCGVQRRCIRAAATRPYVPPPLPRTSASRFPPWCRL